MSDFELKDAGEGRFELSGEISFATADRVLRASESAFAKFQDLQVDLSSVTKADSAGLALLLEWKSIVGRREAQIRYYGLPESIVSIARTTEVEHLL